TMLPLLLLLLAAAHGLERIDYMPTLAGPDLGGRLTGSTFVLEQPRCAFDADIYSEAEIWLVVSTAEATDLFNDSAQPGSQEWAFQRFPNNTSAYLTLGTAQYHYPCPGDPGEITVLRVGSETACANDVARPTCNGPLPGPGPYRVKFLALNNSTPVADTYWSDPITLNKAQQPPRSSGMVDGRHSGGMIVITTLLSILLAVLLAALLATLCSSDPCNGSFSQHTASIQRYNTHHVCEQTAAQL
ncbi:UPK3L protein, partial [Alectura lathami]|nr:UPK3L protein [Alectura lathami]